MFLKVKLLSFIYFLGIVTIEAQPESLSKKNHNTNPALVGNACGTDLFLKQLQHNIQFKNWQATRGRQPVPLSLPIVLDDILVIPVVVHVINNNPDLITDQMIKSGIQDLNEAFSKSGAYQNSKGADARIQFCLARTDPDNGITTGITRTTHYYGHDHNMSIEQVRLKHLVQWDPRQYANIWLIKNVEDEAFTWFSCGQPGSQWTRFRPGAYATMPPDAVGSPFDGIVVPGFGTVLAHEMGHYLGLFHTYEGGCSNFNCDTDGDRVCDTPPDATILGSCNFAGNSCITDSIGINPGFTRDQPDRTNNFMDGPGCANEFTAGQIERMRKTIFSFRSSLLLNKCNPPCNENIIAGFNRTNAYPNPGNTVNFINTSTGASSWQWLVDNVPVSTLKDFSYLFDISGKFKITLKASNGGSCFSTYTDFVTVTCGVAARFWVDKRDIASKGGLFTDSILFTNTSVNATSCKWLLSNDNGVSEKVISTTTGNLRYTFLTPGNYVLRLVASNASCSDTTDFYSIPVADPSPDAIISFSAAFCYAQTKVKADFNVCNLGYMPLKKGTPISFYDSNPSLASAKKLEPTFYLPYDIGGAANFYCCWGFSHIVDAILPNLNQLYVVFNDSGKVVPVSLPNTPVFETSFDNNKAFINNFNYSLTAAPAKATLAPEDTLQLSAVASPVGLPSTYQWSPEYNLSCPKCAVTLLYADTNTVKQVIATSFYGCKDTAFVEIKVPPAYDFTVKLTDVQCAANDDSLHIEFALFNNFKRDIIPKGLQVSFYNGDPAKDTAKLLRPVFKVPASLRTKPFEFTTTIAGMAKGKLFAVVNDNATAIPVKLPNDTTIKEIDYANNKTSYDYTRLTVSTTNPPPVCERDSFSLTAASIPGATFSWTGPAGFVSALQNPVVTKVPAGGAGEYQVKASKYGCTSTAAIAMATVYPAPDITPGYDKPVCDTRQLHLKASTPTGIQFSWSGPGGFNSNLQNPIIASAGFANNGGYNVIATSAKGCTSLPATIQVVVNPLPVPAFRDTNTCLPSTIAVFKNITAISTGKISDYRWNFGEPGSADNTSNSADATHAYNKAGNYQVSLSATSDSGCTVAITQSFNRFHPKPKALFSTSPLQGVCVNELLLLTDESNGADGNLQLWQWSFGDQSPVIQNSLPEEVRHKFEKDGNYQVSLIIRNEFTCGDTISKTVAVYPLPEADAGPVRYVLLGNSTDLLADASGNGLSYLWTPAAYLSTTALLRPAVNRPPADIIYSLKVTTKDGCVASDNVLVKVLLPLKIPNAFSPNSDGINDTWHVSYLADYPGCNVEIFDRYGRIVFRSAGYQKEWDGTQSGKPVPVGVYYYVIDPKNGAARVTGSLTLLR